MLDLAIKECRKLDVFFSNQSFTKTNFKRNFFDIIFSSLSVTYISDLNSAWREFHRILKKGGLAVVIFAHPIRKMIKYTNFNYFDTGKHYEEYAGFTRFAYYHTIEEYLNSAVINGFAIKKFFEPKIIFPQEYKLNESESGRVSPDLYPHFIVLLLEKTK